MKKEFIGLLLIFLQLSAFSQSTFYVKKKNPIIGEITKWTSKRVIVDYFDSTKNLKTIQILYSDLDSLKSDNFNFVDETNFYEPNLPCFYTGNPQIPLKVVKDTILDIKKTGVDTITMKAGKYYYRGNIITRSAILPLIQNIKMAKRKYNSASFYEIVSYVCAIPGGLLIGHPLGGALAGKALNVPILGIGIGLAASSIPFVVLHNLKMRQAIRLYNQKLKVDAVQKQVP